MLLDVLRQLFFEKQITYSYTEVMIFIVASLVVIFVTMPFHEFAHAFVATKLGDKTPRYRGRLTLNPLAHIDYFGALCIILCGFGWANPVPVNPNSFKNPKRDMALTALAGPVMNLLLAFVGSLFCFGFLSAFYNNDNMVFAYISMFFMTFSSLNIGLAVFNLLPIPPLDGWKVLGAFLPARIYWNIMRYEQYISFALILLVFSDVLVVPLNNAINFVEEIVYFIPAEIFGFVM